MTAFRFGSALQRSASKVASFVQHAFRFTGCLPDLGFVDSNGEGFGLSEVEDPRGRRVVDHLAARIHRRRE